MSTIQRITGTNSGLDVDALVKASLTTYQNKVDKETQNKKVLEYQQEQYKQIMNDASSFYNKYCDILKTGNLMSTSAYSTVSFATASGDTSKVTAQGFAGADTSGYKVSVTQLASKATVTLTTAQLTAGATLSVDMGGATAASITIDADINKTVSLLNADLQSKGINASAKYSEFSGGIVIESASLGSSQTVNVKKDGAALANDTGTDLAGTLTKDGGATYTLKGTSNTVTVDNVQFTFKSTIAVGSEVSLTGATNVTDLKDKIVNFVNDYNTLLQSINTKIYETRDKDYMPLTDAQKEAMTESQITSWEKKAQTGLLRRDSDLQRIANEMKSAMSTVISGSGTYLEKIGISPVKDYADKNGMLTVDETKLTAALQDNGANVKDLFTRAASTTTTDKGGIITQLKSVLDSEFKTSSSSLAKKAGIDGTTTEYSNTLTKSIAAKKALITTLNSSLTTRETALYKKYSALETAMEKMNAQQSSLTSMLGTS